MKPILKWVGGKTQIIDDVLASFPDVIENDYYEPFVGGGSVLLAVLSSNRIRINGVVYAGDINDNLIAFYKNIQSRPLEVIEELRKININVTTAKANGVNVRIIRNPANIDEALSSMEAYYYWIRSQFNSLTGDIKTSPQASAMLIFLNKTCFRGLYREGPNGFNVPYGNYRNPSILDDAHIMSVSALIKDVVFMKSSFNETLSTIRHGDFVYMDPPYAPETDTSFVKYTKNGFDKDMHAKLFALCNELVIQHIEFVMSNASVKLVRDAFPQPQFSTKIISCRRAINSKDPSARTDEVLISCNSGSDSA